MNLGGSEGVGEFRGGIPSAGSRQLFGEEVGGRL
jgi:hypothetical protein